MVSIVRTVPLPRRPLAAGDPVREWYEEALGWATAPGPKGLQLLTGLRFDVLELPAEAGRAVLRRLDPGCPVALQGETMRLLVAAGSAEELPGLLDWLEWGHCPSISPWSVRAGGSTRPRPRECRTRRRPLSGCGPRPRMRRRADTSGSDGAVGRRGRWGRPRSRTAGGNGGDSVPPDPVATCLCSAVGLLVGLTDGRGDTTAVVDLVTVLLGPGTDLRRVLAAARHRGARLAASAAWNGLRYDDHP